MLQTTLLLSLQLILSWANNEKACDSSKGGETEYVPWNRTMFQDSRSDSSIFGWIEDADGFVADISEPNHNVTYEVV